IIQFADGLQKWDQGAIQPGDKAENKKQTADQNQGTQIMRRRGFRHKISKISNEGLSKQPQNKKKKNHELVQKTDHFGYDQRFRLLGAASADDLVPRRNVDIPNSDRPENTVSDDSQSYIFSLKSISIVMDIYAYPRPADRKSTRL